MIIFFLIYEKKLNNFNFNLVYKKKINTIKFNRIYKKKNKRGTDNDKKRKIP